MFAFAAVSTSAGTTLGEKLTGGDLKEGEPPPPPPRRGGRKKESEADAHKNVWEGPKTTAKLMTSTRTQAQAQAQAQAR